MEDIIIIGGGVVGCAVARVLSRYEGKITLLEAGTDVAFGASKANSGIVHAGFDAEPGSQKAYYNVLGAAMYEELTEELGVPYRKNEAMVLSFSSEDGATLRKLLSQGEKNGVSGLSLLSAPQVRALEPNVSDAVQAAVLARTSAVVSPYEMTIALAYHAAQNGVRFVFDAPVTQITWNEGVFAVTAGEKAYCAKAIIACAGTHAGKIRSMLSPDELVITPRRGEYYLMDSTLPSPFTRTMFQCPGKMGKGVLVTPTAHGNVLLGPSAEDIAEPDDTATTAEGLSFVLRKAGLTWPEVNTRNVITTFSGIRAHAADGDFHVGAMPGAPEGAFEAAGIESPGLTAAPAIGEKLAEEAAEYLRLSEKKKIIPPMKLLRPFAAMSDEERAAACAENSAYGALVCRCEQVTEAEIMDALTRPVPARTLDAVKRRTRSGMGRCQGGFCSPRILELLCAHTGLRPEEIRKDGSESFILTGRI